MITVKIVENDTSTVAKVIIVDSSNRVLFLKRSKYTDKYAGEWDLPGGHLKKNESLEDGLKREVHEESGLKVENLTFFKKMNNLHFFHCKYNSQPVSLSHEHIDYKFLNKEELNKKEKFQKLALQVIETLENFND